MLPMIRSMASALMVCLLLAAGPLALQPARAAGALQLEVRVQGLESDEGSIAFALYDSKQSYKDRKGPLRRGFVPIESQASTWTLELPAGEYALSLYHDVNGNQKLDTNAMGIPAEPYGFSNDARGNFGPPKYSKVRFELKESRAIDVQVR